MKHLNQYIVNQDDPYMYVYEGLSGTHGVELRDYLTELYSDVVIDSGYHPDDDFEQIIERMLDLIESEYA